MLKVLFLLASRLPLPWLHAIGALAGAIGYRCASRFRGLIDANLAQAGYTDAALRRQAAREIGKAMFEVPAIWLRPHAEVAALVREARGWDLVEAAQEADRPIVFLTPHLGCFEITAQYYAHRAPATKPVTVLYRRPRQAAFSPLMQAGRGRANMKLAASDLGGVRALIRALKSGESAGVLPDQTPRFGEGAWAPFFGRPAFTMTLVARLARASDALVLLIHAERLPRGRGYRIVVEPFGEPFVADATAAATQMNHALERLIRRLPAQYLWNYNRYKVPPGVPAPPPAAASPVSPASPASTMSSVSAASAASADATPDNKLKRQP